MPTVHPQQLSIKQSNRRGIKCGPVITEGSLRGDQRRARMTSAGECRACLPAIGDKRQLSNLILVRLTKAEERQGRVTYRISSPNKS